MPKTVLAISGSHRKNSFTEKMLDLCLEGMGQDLDVYKFYPHEMKIKPCTSCWSCWTKTKGECVFKDDFQKISNIYMKADYFLIASPLYYFTFPATVKNVIDRFFVYVKPEQVSKNNGATTHPIRGDRHPKTVLISSCGYPEVDNFVIQRTLFRKICKEMEWEYSGEILIPGAGARSVPKLFDQKLEQIIMAGTELRAGHITDTTSEFISRPVMSAEDYRKMCSARFGGKVGKLKAAYIGFKNAFFKRRKNSESDKKLLSK